MAIPMLKIRRPLGRLIFNMGIAIPGKTVFLIETAPRIFIAAILNTSYKTKTVGIVIKHCYSNKNRWIFVNNSILIKWVLSLHNLYHILLPFA